MLSARAPRRLELDMLASWLRFQRAYEAVAELASVAPEAEGTEELHRRLADLERTRLERDLAERALFDRYRLILGRDLPDLSAGR
ncbi:MAG: hypothetical protein ACREI6_03825 [Candidatus Rokuibacteriota bacterium]